MIATEIERLADQVHCPACDDQISKDVDRCPGCRYPISPECYEQAQIKGLKFLEEEELKLCQEQLRKATVRADDDEMRYWERRLGDKYITEQKLEAAHKALAEAKARPSNVEVRFITDQVPFLTGLIRELEQDLEKKKQSDDQREAWRKEIDAAQKAHAEGRSVYCLDCQRITPRAVLKCLRSRGCCMTCGHPIRHKWLRTSLAALAFEIGCWILLLFLALVISSSPLAQLFFGEPPMAEIEE